MTPNELADEIDRWSNFTSGEKTTMQLTPQGWNMLAAALRLAEATCVFVVASGSSIASWWECRVCGECTMEASPDALPHAPDCLFAAYRKAREVGK